MENKCKAISFVNQKGGVAKTSSAIIMAYILAKDYNKKVCLIDFDGQANASKTMGIEEELNKDLKENEAPILLQDIEWTIADIMNKIIQDEEISDEELEKYIYHLR